MRVIRIGLLALLALCAAAAVYLFLPDKKPDEPPATPAPAPEQPKPLPREGRLGLPDDFPKEHANHFLQVVNAEKPIRGVKTYFTALYWGDPESEISVRLLGIDPATATEFVAGTLSALAASPSVKEIGPVDVLEDSGWLEAKLFSREEAGIFTASNTHALLMVSAPTPEAAKQFGASLWFEAGPKPTPQAETKKKEAK